MTGISTEELRNEQRKQHEKYRQRPRCQYRLDPDAYRNDDPAFQDVFDDRPTTVGPDQVSGEYSVAPDRREVVRREKEAFGGLKFGSAFFGWLAASGTALLLTTLVASAVASCSSAAPSTPRTPTSTRYGRSASSAASCCSPLSSSPTSPGGYVAGRMARFNGARQGFGVWLWALIFAVVIAGFLFLAGARFDVLARLNSFPRLPVNEGTLTTAGILVAVGMLPARQA